MKYCHYEWILPWWSAKTKKIRMLAMTMMLRTLIKTIEVRKIFLFPLALSLSLKGKSSKTKKIIINHSIYTLTREIFCSKLVNCNNRTSCAVFPNTVRDKENQLYSKGKIADKYLRITFVVPERRTLFPCGVVDLLKKEKKKEILFFFKMNKPLGESVYDVNENFPRQSGRTRKKEREREREKKNEKIFLINR